MTDHRRLQRALFRLQLDHGLARAVLGGDDAAAEELGLADADLALLRGVDLAGVTADPGGRRRTQVLGNASSEFQLTLAGAAQIAPDLLQAFARSRELHAAVRDDHPLPFAFAAYARARLSEAGETLLLGVLALEERLARARRAHRAPEPPPRTPGADVAFAPGVALVELPAGTYGFAERLRAALDVGGAAPPTGGAGGAAGEAVLVHPTGAASPHALAEARAEPLRPPADELLARIDGQAAERPFDAAARAAFAREAGASPEELEGFLDELVADGVLVRCGAR